MFTRYEQVIQEWQGNIWSPRQLRHRFAFGNAFIWPRVYLNSTETLTGATEMIVQSVAADGTSITFNDPVGSPTGSLFLGVENRSNGDVGWTPVIVSANGPIVIFGSFGA